jgi:ABC-2 type transport system permease protein
VFGREYLERVRSKWFVFATVAGPLVFGGIAIGQVILTQRAQTSADVSHVIVLDATGAELGRRVSENLGGDISGDTSTAEVQVVTPDSLASAQQAALQRVMHRDRVGYLVLDDSTLAGEHAHYAGRNASSIPDIERITTAVRDAVLTVRLERAGLDPKRIRALTTLPLTVSADRVTDQGLGASGLSSAVLGYIVAFVLYMMIVLYGQAVLRGVMEEKTTRVAEVIVSSVPSRTLLAGKVLGVGSVAVTQEIVWVVASVALFAARAPILRAAGVANVPVSFPSVSVGTGILLLLFFLLGFFFYAALFAAVGAAVNNSEDAQQAALPVMLLLVSTIALVVPVLLSPAEPLAQVMSIIPFSAPILMPLRLSVMQVPWPEVALALVSLAASCAAAIWFASRVYRVGLLMYGKRPGIREIVRWVRAR